VAKAYILYRERRTEEREEKKEQLVREFEKHTLKVTKSNGTKETFDIKKLKLVFDRAAKGYRRTLPLRGTHGLPSRKISLMISKHLILASSSSKPVSIS
jgi:hypothetical protein